MKPFLAFIALLPAAAFAQTREVVVPNELEDSFGNAGPSIPFNIGAGSARFQQVYAGQQFTNAGPDGILITKLFFRTDESGRGFNTTISNIQINFSTTSRMPDSLSPVFAENIGADDATIVGPGPLALRGLGPGGTADWFIHIDLPTPFFYQPSAGNLLMDVRNFSGGDTTFFDGANTFGDGISLVYAATGDGSGSVDSTSGLLRTAGLVTRFQFTVIPEPGTMALFACGIGALTLWVWKTERTRRELSNLEGKKE
ncbi:MAG: hypothetical protein L0220_31260 [Acidobacteria bacterium]|nr:hypothetical protein [Acidobacteriota bacterium]